MRLRDFIHSSLIAGALTLGTVGTALANDGGHNPHGPGTAPAGPDHRPMWHGGHGPQQPVHSVDPAARAAWLSECRQRVNIRDGNRDQGWGGAAIGAVVGGVAGNRIAGRRHRTEGTLAGAAVGAAAGMAIDRAGDRGQARDYCEAYFDDYYAFHARQAYAAPAYGYYAAPAYQSGHAAACACSQPAMMAPAPRRAEPACTETIEYEYEYVPVRPRPRAVPQRRVVPDKRIRVAPDKRIPL